MPPASTVDSFQGREGDIVVVVLGTNSQSGAGFTKDPHRFNVLLTRQRCGLVIVGDLSVVPALGGAKRKKVISSKTTPNCVQNDNVTIMWNVFNCLFTDGRVVNA